ncbi:c-type cytochrome, methanol metabolism-related [Paracoccus homiensis]|uniref:C-type cytochrome, methanol metabolism-related n=1 Tax=Paracoccus homiensis TaxID=364199 RepID=A0A1I0ASB1_9RHOB|nr:c-type cytochrome, methanol metabolism-related [Paracoccus homiensis]SES97270.1 c-type cytochrome, methanol metabolism-related [Paracoccus homiensis]
MKAITSLTALVLGASLAVPAFAQSETPPAEAGAGAAAAVSGGGDSAPADTQEGGNDAPVDMAEGQTTLPNGMDITPDYTENGRWYNADDIPTFKIEEDGTVDFATFNGFRRYSAECHVCHGPDGEGSTYAPALKDSVLRMDYYDFMQVVASGKQEVNSAQNQVMPAFGTNKNVWCYIDDIYAYLLARGVDELPRGRPAKKGPKTDEFAAQEDSCMSM